MTTVYDVRQLLKRFGIYIYIGNRMSDLELMEMELEELYKMEFISIKQYQQARVILRKEKNYLNNF